MKPGRIVIILLIILIGIVIYRNKFSGESGIKNASQGKQNQPVQVNAVIASTSTIANDINCTGTILANEEAEVRNEIGGRIAAINFKEGSSVKKGDLLVKIVDDDLKATLKKLELQEELAAKNEAREKDLLSIQGVSQQDYETALNQLNTIRADIAFTRAQIAKTEIHAPFDGIIGLKNISPGSFIANNTLITRIQDIQPVKIDLSIPERYADKITVGGEVNFTSESVNGNFSGKIYAIEPKIDPETRSMLVRATYENSDRKIFPGAFVNVVVPLKKIENTILLPTQCVIPELKGKSVMICKDGLAQKVMVKTGLRNDSTVEIREGISAGDTVLTTGIMQVRPKMPLNVKLAN